MFNKTFCSSPWFHFRITYNGSYESCRWAKNPQRIHKFQNQTLLQYYNSDQMRTLRQELLNGQSPEHCASCYYEESFGKLNGRVRQLHKSAVDTSDFDLTMRSSPHYNSFKHSMQNNGHSSMEPVDLQIELGNTCNSACIMCGPEASSRLEQDYKKLHLIDSKLFAKPDAYVPWTKDEKLVDRFIDELVNIKNLKYIHFLGGETLYEHTFYRICDELCDSDLAKNIIIGTTTNGTLYNEKIEKYIKNFKEFHLGISIESVTSLNDYIRYPSTISSVIENIKKFLQLRNQNTGLKISLRITPNIFSIYELDELFLFMLENQVGAESCNILHNPRSLRIELIPDDIRQEIKKKFEKIINDNNLDKHHLVNTRDDNLVNHAIGNIILDYYKFICEYKLPENIEECRFELVKFIKGFEALRKNTVLDYLPRYENFLRRYNY